MTDLVDGDHACVIVDQIDDAVVTLADTISVFVAGELLRAAWARVHHQRLDLCDDPLTVSLRPYSFELLPSGRLDGEAI